MASLYEQGKEEENKAALASFGGVDGLSKALNSNLDTGIASSTLETRRSKFGSNVLPAAVMESWLALFFGSFNDEVLISEYHQLHEHP